LAGNLLKSRSCRQGGLCNVGKPAERRRPAAQQGGFFVKLLVLCALLSAILGSAVPVAAAPPSSTKAVFQPLAKPGEKIALDADHYFTFGFDKPPKLGTAIVRVEIFSRSGNRDTSFQVKGDADMPSMRGVHSSGDKDFSLSNKGVYLLPVRLVMPGDWEIRFTFLKKGVTAFRGAYLFDL
jgi:hypothetical protein